MRGSPTIKVKGSLIAHVTLLNTMSLEDHLALIKNASGRANSPEAFERGSKDILESEISGLVGEFESLLEQRIAFTITAIRVCAKSTMAKISARPVRSS
jgi:hypothetical protein